PFELSDTRPTHRRSPAGQVTLRVTRPVPLSREDTAPTRTIGATVSRGASARARIRSGRVATSWEPWASVIRRRVVTTPGALYPREATGRAPVSVSNVPLPSRSHSNREIGSVRIDGAPSKTTRSPTSAGLGEALYA